VNKVLLEERDITLRNCLENRFFDNKKKNRKSIHLGMKTSRMGNKKPTGIIKSLGRSSWVAGFIGINQIVNLSDVKFVGIDSKIKHMITSMMSMKIVVLFCCFVCLA